MDEDTLKLIAYAVGLVIALYVISALLPFLILFLALCGAWYLWRDYHRR